MISLIPVFNSAYLKENKKACNTVNKPNNLGF